MSETFILYTSIAAVVVVIALWAFCCYKAWRSYKTLLEALVELNGAMASIQSVQDGFRELEESLMPDEFTKDLLANTEEVLYTLPPKPGESNEPETED